MLRLIWKILRGSNLFQFNYCFLWKYVIRKMVVFYGVIVSLALFTLVDSYNILAVFPHEGNSHLWVFKPIIEKLASRGHKLTVILHQSFNVDADGYEEILLHDPDNRGSEIHPIEMDSVRWTQFITAQLLMEEGLNSCKLLLSNKEVQKLIRSKPKFDLIIAEFFNSECALGFMNQFKVPIVSLSSTTMFPYHNDRFSNPENPSYIPNNHFWGGDKMDFFERVENVLITLWYKFIHLWYLDENRALLVKHFNENIPDLRTLTQNVSLMLLNSHFSLSFSRPLVPGVVEIGGVHIGHSKKLPQNIEKFINESQHGVIYFSLGSMIKGHTLPHDKRKAFLKVFSRLPQRVLWKWENESMPDKPDNVMIQKWMPQFDILSHPNVKAFISHGGLLGTTEAVHCGVPMVVMPQYGDQHTNAKAIEANGGGVILYLNDVTEETLYESLQKILDPAFQQKAKELSERFRDRPMSPMDTAIYWVEYVARHKGAPHLRTAAVGMPLYQYLLLDVIGFLIAVLLIFIYITYKILSLTIGVVWRKKVKQS